jgi:ABC-type nitrate/sulfonate/bicarbonate transport system permease component
VIRGRVTDWGLALVLPVLLLVAYDGWARTAGDFFFPPLSEIGATFADEWLFTRIPTDLLPSLGRMLAGFALAVGGGVALGALLGFSRTLSTALDPVLQFLRALPPPALIPVSLLVFGAGDSAKVFLIALGAVWPVLLNTVDGVRGVDRTALDMAHSYRVPAHARLTRLVLPAALPRIFAGARTALGIAIILMVVSELIGADNGVGYVVQLAQRGFDIRHAVARLAGLRGQRALRSARKARPALAHRDHRPGEQRTAPSLPPPHPEADGGRRCSTFVT